MFGQLPDLWAFGHVPFGLDIVPSRSFYVESGIFMRRKSIFVFTMAIVVLTVAIGMVLMTSPSAKAAPALARPAFSYAGNPATFSSTWFQGFEDDAIDWTATTRVPSGTNGVTSSTGAYHAEATSGAFTRFNAYSAVWPGDYSTEIDVYLDPNWAVGQGFDYSVATSGTTNAHRRDFIFHVGVTPSNGLRVNADNNTYLPSGVPNAFILNGAGSVEITAAGWYKLQHVFYDDGGVLAVDLRVLNSSGTAIFDKTRKDLTDLIGVTVGGNRYGWFVFSTRTLAVDNHRRATAVAQAPGSTNLTITPYSPVFDANNVVGVAADPAPGFPGGSFASNGLAKTDIYLTPEALFQGRQITVGQVARMSYWTKTGTTHAVNPADWFMAIYTKPFAGDVSTPSWYGSRFGTEPYFSASILDPANTWNLWSTNLASNRLRFFESTQGAPGANFGTYTDPHWASFIAADSLGTSVQRASQSILFFSIQTGSSWAAGFTGQLDGLRIELTDGSVATVNFEPDTTAPAVPTHLSPADGTVTTTAAQQLIDWSDVTDPSTPVTYYYEASLNNTTSGPGGAFTSPVYVSGPLAASQIPTLGTPVGTYYWHVRAVDALGNSSAWSDPWQIIVNPPPAVVASSPLTFGDSQTLTRAFGATGTETYNVVSGPCSISGDQLTANSGTGSCDVTVTVTDGNNFAETSIPVTVTLAKANATCIVTGYVGVFDALPHGASGTCTGVGGADLSAGLNLGPSFTNVPGGTANWSFTGGANYNDQNGAVSIVITPAPTTVTVNCPASVPFNGSARTPCTASVSGPGLSQSLSVSYTNNVAVGTATASASYAGGGNYQASSGNKTFLITASTPPNANACKNGGWMTWTRANGTTFRNQGDCIQYINTGK